MQRKLDVGEVIRGVFEIYVDQASILMPAAAVVFAFTGILSAVLVAASPALALLALVIYIVATTLFTGMVVELVADIQDGRRDSTVRQLLNAAMPVIGRLILVGIAAAVGIVLGFILFIIPGLILITVWSVAAPVVVLERPPGFGALRRSRELVSGNGWPVFLVIIVLYILVAVGASLIELGADSAGAAVGLVVRVVVGILTAPITALAAAVLYFALRGTSTPPAPAELAGDPGPAPEQTGEPAGTIAPAEPAKEPDDAQPSEAPAPPGGPGAPPEPVDPMGTGQAPSRPDPMGTGEG